MTKTDMRRPALQNDLYIRSEELPGTPAREVAADQDIEANADDLVRQLLIEEKRRTMPERLPEIAPQEDVLVFDPQAPENRRQTRRESIAEILKAERAAQAQDEPARRRWLRLPSVALPRLRVPGVRLPRIGRLSMPVKRKKVSGETKGRGLALPVWLRTYRPTRKHIAWAVIAALVLYRPLMLPLIALLLVWLVVIAYLTLGPDRWGEILGGAWQRLHARRPDLAERLRVKADRFAEKFDRVLDRLPEAWADRLALPDFSTLGQEEDDRPDPFERLSAEARQI